MILIFGVPVFASLAEEYRIIESKRIKMDEEYRNFITLREKLDQESDDSQIHLEQCACGRWKVVWSRFKKRLAKGLNRFKSERDRLIALKTIIQNARIEMEKRRADVELKLSENTGKDCEIEFRAYKNDLETNKVTPFEDRFLSVIKDYLTASQLWVNSIEMQPAHVKVNSFLLQSRMGK